ncbi:MAG: OmpA family protein [Burkholderiaceae bacterium]|nr:OmpA family protein [Burkholderiaceae bacterium]
MRYQFATGTLGLLALTVVVSPLALAQDSGWYAGGNVGRATTTIDDARITSGLLGAGIATTSITDRDSDTGYKVYGGYQFNRYLGVEGGFYDLGRYGFTANTSPAGTLNGDIRLRGLNLDLVGTLPIAGGFSAFGRVGAAYTQARDQFSSTGIVVVTNPSPSQREANLKLGLGLQYAFNESLAMRLEAERYRVNDAVGNRGNVDMVSLGLIYRFGAKTQLPAPQAAMPAPAVYAAAPPPAVVVPPAAVVAPPPALPVRVSFSADALFDFDKSEIKPAGKQELDRLASELRGARFEAIQVTGHTDRLGPHDYNQRLSTRRAEAVSAYLVQSAAIAPGKIASRGVNGSDPVTKPGECKGNKATPQLIACLQPDRRVDVEVTATK